MIESIKEYWYLWLVLAGLIAVLVFVLRKASAAAKKKSEVLEKQRQEFERFRSFYERYKNLDKVLAENSDAKELAEGVTAVLQYNLEKSDNPDAEYKNAEQWKREVYALFYFDEDVTKEGLSFFFRHNDEPLPSVVISGIKSIGADNIYQTVAQMYSMYDENNESVSLDKTRVLALDEHFKSIYRSDDVFVLVKKYIEENL